MTNKIRLFSVFLVVFSSAISAKEVISIDTLTNENRILNGDIELHLLASDNPMTNSSVNLASENAWLFFDNVKPSVVVNSYKNYIRINDETLSPNVNARVCRYINGTVVVPHASGYSPLQVFTDTDYSGSSATYTTDYYYTAQPGEYVPASLKRSPGIDDNAIRSFKLKRGYMATLANNADGTGYSRVFIADTADLNVPELPDLLDKKVSFIRVFKWDWVSKKGWCGTTDVEAQADQVDCTWFYSWGVGNATTYNLEFCPEKWGPNWPGWSDIAAKTGVAHLLGYNEPDHTEQSNTAVVQAISEWPKALQTGLRLGSPATTDFDWLYDFLDQCEEKNYRVDYVVVHAYWGGLTPKEWYEKLQLVHEKTGKPIWIKEWNNGANWTNEGWPSTTAEQQAKQLADLTGILNVLDTAHFMERYAIYNWVEDKRAMILNWSETTKSGTLTPAGSYYKSNKSRMAYNVSNEVIPTWEITEAPVLSYTFDAQNNDVDMSWTDYNQEMIAYYIIERSSDNTTFSEIGRTPSGYVHTFTDSITNEETAGMLYYRVKSVGLDSTVTSSNSIFYTVLSNTATIHLDRLIMSSSDLTLNLYKNAWEETPVLISGTPTYRNKFPLFPSISLSNNNYFNLTYTAWIYQENPTLKSRDTVAILALPEGKAEWNGITALAGKITGINTQWKRYTFTDPFSVTPVVFCNRVSKSTAAPSIVRIKNVTTTGFDVSLQYEEEITPSTITESLCFLALTPGTGMLDGKKIKVGLTEAGAVGSFLKSGTISFGDSFTDPRIFTVMQTISDSIASNLRIKKWTDMTAEVFQEREISSTTTDVTMEQVGWFIIESGLTSSLNRTNAAGQAVNVFFDAVNNRFIFSDDMANAKAKLVDLLGRELTNASRLQDLHIPCLNAGVYLLILNNSVCLKFLK